MSPPVDVFFFAAVGDVHGAMRAMVQRLVGWERRTKQKLSFVLQVGDFEPHRDDADLASMAAPSKYKQLGDFPEFARGTDSFPWPVTFIGGNHEPYGFLDTRPEGHTLVERCTYLGRVGHTKQNGLSIVGLSGIYREDVFLKPRPPITSLGTSSNKVFAYFNEADIEKAIAFDRADILLVHDWPEGIAAETDNSFDALRRSQRYEGIGNSYTRMLVDALRPRLLLCGHMHQAHRTVLRHPSGAVTQVCCLASVAQGNDAFAVFRVENGVMQEVPFDR